MSFFRTLDGFPSNIRWDFPAICSSILSGKELKVGIVRRPGLRGKSSLNGGEFSRGKCHHAKMSQK